ncbi:probable serine/threonine-protein kinase MARK-A [Rhagoletis pomonella]|uniref:probable serine/threonine-protein kinase MARK-A n=1 Tax=Rhagoletis pomonella TaxID=28610 RepID=UPI0017802E92|nr:probable serine/threonine-protein kinase MARK-A [Rhagoletis pomonella]
MQPAKMETKRTIWYSCNQEIQSQDNDNNNHNNSNEMNNDSNNNAHVHNADAQVTFNHSKATELRQTRLQRQHEQQHNSPPPLTPASPISASSSSTQSAPPPLNGGGEKLRSSAAPHRLPRRKRLQRQKPTELDDADFAYAADLEEEDEEEELVVVTQPPPSVRFNTTSLIGGPSRGTELHSTPSYVTEKRLHHFQQQHHSTPFDGQPSSLPNCFASAATISIFHHHHHHHQREHRLKHEESFDSSTTTTTNTTDTATSPASPLLRRHNFAMLKRDNSTHSESSSRYSSVDSLLEARKPDPEAILINLGFGPVGSEDILSRIPKRFLKPSQVRGIDTEAFIRRLQLANNLADHSVLGYRGLTGNPDIPPSRIVAKIMHRFEVNERKKSMGSIEQTI